MVWRRKIAGSGLLKMYSNYNRPSLAVYQPNIDDLQNPTHVRLQNDNLYMNTSYQNLLNEKWMLHSGVSYTYDHQQLTLNQNPIEQQQQGLHAKAMFTLDASENVSIHLGSEYLYNRFEQAQKELAQTPQRITSRVYEDPDLAARFIKKLSEVYRYVLDTRHREVVSLQEELAFLESYIFLQKIRYENNLQINLQLPRQETIMIPPLSLQMLLENAIKLRYEYLTKKVVEVLSSPDEFTVKLPVLVL